MPPKGKTPLTEDEIALVHWWIQSGAGFDKKVAQMPKEDKVKSYLASIGSGGGSSTSGPTESAVFKEKVSAASEQEIKKLTDLNALVMPVAKEQHFLEANFINAKGFDDSKAPLLGGLSEQLVWLKLGRTNISDKAMDEIARLKNLSKLHLEHTGISDAGIAKLKDMKYLEYINLFDTRVTDAGIKELAKLKSLKKVYVWQTKVTRYGIEMLKKAIPGVEVDSGWEMKVPVPADSAQKESLARK
ncbi:leucine-rich repeat domain-containing protein [Pseudarcicella hirudinis]